MPGFKKHFSFGILAGGAFTLWATTMHGVPQSFIAPLLAGASVGAILPDFDSDSSVASHLASLIVSVVVGMAAFQYFKSTVTGMDAVLLRTAGTVLITVFVLCPLVRRLTTHRGIWHSIPAALIATLATLLFLQKADVALLPGFYVALSLGVGYVSHLVLDEGESLFHFKFLIFWSPRKSLGSALKFVGESTSITLFTYLILICLAFLSYPLLIKILPHFFKSAREFSSLVKTGVLV